MCPLAGRPRLARCSPRSATADDGRRPDASPVCQPAGTFPTPAVLWCASGPGPECGRNPTTSRSAVGRGGAPRRRRTGAGRRSPRSHRPDADPPPWSGDRASTRWPRYAPWLPPRSLCATTPAAPAALSGRRDVHGGRPNTPGTDAGHHVAAPGVAETRPPTAAPGAGAPAHPRRRARGGPPTPAPRT
jgi:hypothetical protein